ncbi:LysR family transcriptional regulator [Actinomycetospora sp. CA-084318]|uniref:LysR family transcriptional regulator n=1 Tax=Actinomycetospora sp. CA-084318 TaxID=3239892 RepID=UPI003D982446
MGGLVLDLGVNHLRALAAVHDAGGFGAAARRLGTTQSAVSRLVAEAERRLRVPVFARTTRRVVPTEHGRAVLPLVRRLVDDHDAGLAHIEGYLAGTWGTVSVAALPSLAAIVVPPVVAEHRRRHPDVEVRVRDGLAESVADLLARGVIDLAVTARTGPREDSAVPIARDRFVLLAADGHPLATRSSVDWAELDGTSMVVFGERSSIRRPVEDALRAAGARPGSVQETQNVAAVAGLVAAGLGVTAVPGFVLPLVAFAGLRRIDLVPVVTRDVEVRHDPRRPLSAAATSFRDALVESAPVLLPDLAAVEWQVSTRWAPRPVGSSG